MADPQVPGGHADSFTTSIVMYCRPDALRRDRVPDGQSMQPEWSDAALDFSLVSFNGIIGTAAHATEELGRRLWEASVTSVIETLRLAAAAQTDTTAEPTT